MIMSTKQLKLGVLLTIVLSFLALGSACSKEPTNDSAATNESAAAGVPYTPGSGSVTGAIAYNGAAPAPKKIDSSADPACGQANPNLSTEDAVVKDGKLANVFVYVKDGLGARTYAVPATPVMLEQRGCRYVPHVFGVQAGQTIQVANNDTTLHNVHALPKNNREFNFGQPANVPAVPRVFDKPEIGLPFRCDVHGWMSAYVNVVAHPFFAVTNDAGGFEIKGLPPGAYTIELWHERLGTQSQSVTVDGKTPATMKASFKQAS